MNIINQLPKSVANQIAAGEVIQRPSSIIKELVENSIDAKAKNIKIIIKDAGKQSISVIVLERLEVVESMCRGKERRHDPRKWGHGAACIHEQ